MDFTWPMMSSICFFSDPTCRLRHGELPEHRFVLVERQPHVVFELER
jgi:hypothetical protein